MSMSFACPKCHQAVKVSPEWAGKMARCPGCGQPIQVPASPPGPSAPGATEQSVVKPCPQCAAPLKLSAKFQGRKIRCTSCRATLAVAAGSWTLTVVEGPAAPSRDAGPQAVASAAPHSTPPPSFGSFQDDLFSELPPVPQGQPGLDPFAAAQGAPLGGPLAAGAPLAAPRRGRSAKPLLIAGMIAGGVLALTLVVGLIVMLVSSVGGGSVSAYAYLPDNCKAVGTVDVRGLLASKPLRDAMQGNSEFEKLQEEMKRATGLTVDDVVRVTVGIDPSAKSENFVAVVELRRAIDKESTIKSLPKAPTEEKIGNAVLYAGLDRSDVGLHFANDRTVVVGSLSELRGVLQRNRKAQFPAALQEAVDRLDRSQTVSVAILGGEQSMRPGGGMPFGAAEMFSGIQAAVVNVKATSDLRVSATVICKDEKVAEDLKKMIDGGLAMLNQAPNAPPEAKEMLDSLKITRSGRNLNAQITVTEKMLSSMPGRRGPGGVKGPGLPF